MCRYLWIVQSGAEEEEGMELGLRIRLVSGLVLGD